MKSPARNKLTQNILATPKNCANFDSIILDTPKKQFFLTFFITCYQHMKLQDDVKLHIFRYTSDL